MPAENPATTGEGKAGSPKVDWDTASRDTLRQLFGKHGSSILWGQALAAILVGLVAGAWLDVGSWFGASAETHRAVLTFVAATFVAPTALLGAGFTFISAGIQERYAGARERLLAAVPKPVDEKTEQVRRMILDADYPLDLFSAQVQFDNGEDEMELHWKSCKRAAKDDFVARRFHRTFLKATVSFTVVSFAFLVVESAYNPVELLIVGYFLITESWFLANILTSYKIDDDENLIAQDA